MPNLLPATRMNLPQLIRKNNHLELPINCLFPEHLYYILSNSYRYNAVNSVKGTLHCSVPFLINCLSGNCEIKQVNILLICVKITIKKAAIRL